MQIAINQDTKILSGTRQIAGEKVSYTVIAERIKGGYDFHVLIDNCGDIVDGFSRTEFDTMIPRSTGKMFTDMLQDYEREMANY